MEHVILFQLFFQNKSSKTRPVFQYIQTSGEQHCFNIYSVFGQGSNTPQYNSQPGTW